MYRFIGPSMIIAVLKAETAVVPQIALHLALDIAAWHKGTFSLLIGLSQGMETLNGHEFFYQMLMNLFFE